MKKNKVNRIFRCMHCAQEYVPFRSDQKFCSHGCRSNNWAMNQVKKPKLPVNTNERLGVISDTKVKGGVLRDVIVAGAGVTVDNLIKTARKVNNSHLSAKLDKIIAEINTLNSVLNTKKPLEKNQLRPIYSQD